VAAIVSRGGRPDLARPRLPWVTAPTLLVVGGADLYVLDLNRRAQGLLHCRNDLRIVAGAGHLFAQPGALDTVATFATEWFEEHLTRSFAELAR
jgi:pimeloyl-ACP methyl ester carboxylesterase